MSEDDPHGFGGQPDHAASPPTEVGFRVDPRLTAVKAAGAVIFLGLTLLSYPDPARALFGGLAALVVGGYTVRDLLAPRRLHADATGVTLVAGFLGRRRLAWEQIERVRVDERRRLGLRSELLEIDSGDGLHLFSGYDLGVPVWQAVRALAALAPAGLVELPASH